MRRPFRSTVFAPCSASVAYGRYFAASGAGVTYCPRQLLANAAIAASRARSCANTRPPVRITGLPFNTKCYTL